MKRSYLAYVNEATGELALPWPSMVMMSLLLRGEVLSPSEIALDLTDGDRDLSDTIRAAVQAGLLRLLKAGHVERRDRAQYAVTDEGYNAFLTTVQMMEGRDALEASDTRLVAKPQRKRRRA